MLQAAAMRSLLGKLLRIISALLMLILVVIGIFETGRVYHNTI